MLDIDKFVDLRKSLNEVIAVKDDVIIDMKLNSIMSSYCIKINLRSDDFETFVKNGLSKIRNGLIIFEATRQIDIVNKIRNYANKRADEVNYKCSLT
jgi:hypothetical protein